jgi:hypothetical protein
MKPRTQQSLKLAATMMTAAACLFCACGCGVIDNWVGDLTKRTVDASQDVADNSVTSAYWFAVLAEQVSISPGQTQTVGPESLNDICDPIKISRLQLGQMAFFLTYDIDNLGQEDATVVVSISPNDPSQPAVQIASIAVPAQQAANAGVNQTLDATAQAINAQLTAVLNQVDSNLNAYVHLAVEGGDGAGVLVKQLGVAAPPAYLHSQLLTDQGMNSHVKVVGVSDVQLLGAMTNNGAAAAEVRFYLRRASVVNTPDEPVGVADLQPGETVAGEQMLAADGADRVKAAFEQIADGDDVYFFLTIVSSQTVQFTSDLQFDAHVEVELQPF